MITVTGVIANNKEYDGTTTAVLNTAAPLLSGDWQRCSELKYRLRLGGL